MMYEVVLFVYGLEMCILYGSLEFVVVYYDVLLFDEIR